LVAFGIRQTDVSQRHVAIIYESDNGDVRMSHLRFHLFWEDAEYDHLYYWTHLPDLEPEERPTVIGFLAMLTQLRPSIPMGFRAAGCKFTVDEASKTMTFTAGAPGTGLTCTTYIALVFSSLNLPLIDESTWPSRSDDHIWQTSVLEKLRQMSASPEHITALQATIGAARIRPEEIVAAGTLLNWPVSFTRAEAIAREVLAELN
jgi:hypothetical protein